MQAALNSNKIVDLANVHKFYATSGDVALSNVNLSVAPGEFIGLVGPTGSGKSMLLKVMAGLERETSGSVRRPERVAFVAGFKDLFPWLNVFENIAFSLNAKGVRGVELQRAVSYFIDLMKLSGFENLYPDSLPEDLVLRVSIARALACNPDVLLMDAPFSSLDVEMSSALYDDLLRVWAHSRQTIIMASQSIEEAVTLSNRIVVMRDGSVAAIHPIELKYPRRGLANEFIDTVNRIRMEFFH
jgi:NitT/TauT family transport system ATP-binding protein